MPEKDRLAYFFDQGIRFECRRCGTCCTGSPGTIYVGPDELAPIAEFFGCDSQRFKADFLYPFKDSYSIREHADGRCVFYRHGCQIYPVRPRQCRTFPFWFGILRSEASWRRATESCPGIGRGRRYSREEILEIVRTTF